LRLCLPRTYLTLKQLFTFFILSYVISWTIWFPLYAPSFGQECLPTFLLNHGLGGLGPLLASFLTTFIYRKRKGVKELLKKCIQIRPLAYLSIALLGPFLLVFVAATANYLVNDADLNISGLWITKEFPSFSFLSFFFYNLVFFGFGEEAGWRGFALPRLQEKYGALSSSIILTMFWAVWHWPLFLYRPGFVSMDIPGIFGWVFSLLTGSILLTWLFNSSRGSILICAIFHTTVDVAFTADISDKNVINYLGILITLWGLLTILLFKAKNLSKMDRIRSK